MMSFILGLLSCVLLFFASSAFADDTTLQFEISSMVPIVSADAIVVGAKGNSQKISVQKITKQSEDNWVIQIAAPHTFKGTDAKISLIAKDSNGKLLPAPARFIDPSSRSLLPQKGQCARRTDLAEIEKLFQLDHEALSTLVEVRVTKAEILEKKLRSALTPELLAKLSALEQASGIALSEDISAKTPAKDIAWRLSLLDAVLR